MRRVVVTGGARGLGLGICQRLVHDGYYVVTCSRKLSAELSLVLKQKPSRIEHHLVDFAKPGAAAEFARQARVLEGVHGFIANAGIGLDGLLTLTQEAAARECLEVNLLAPILLAREIIKGMLDEGGVLIFVSSVAARAGFTGLSVYSATKGALVSFSRSVAREYGERGIRSNCLLPGFLETDMSQSLGQENRSRLVRRTPLKRLGLVEDAVGAVSFLLSDEARFISGTELLVDGGMLA
jgi:3-oxoacyl-[acyl-carrier protein] reductase